MSTRWVVTCEDFTTKPFPTFELAQRKMDSIVRFSQCSKPHRIEEVTE